MQALQCDYCETVTPIPRAAPTAGKTGQRLIPLSVDDKAFACGVLRYLSLNDLVPDDMVERAVLSVKSSYLPCFAHAVSYTASWTASFGYSRTETYVDHVNRQVDGQSQRVAVTKTRTVVDWRPASGQDAGKFTLLDYGGNSLPAAALPLLERLYCIILATPFKSAYHSGVEIEPYSPTPNAAALPSAAQRADEVIGTLVKRHAQGDRQRDWHWNASTSWDTSAVYVPVGHVLIAYGGKQYKAWVDGTNNANMVTDALPPNKVKGNHMVRGRIAPLLATTALMVAGLASTSFLHEMKMERFAAVGVLLLLAIWRDNRRIKRSQRTRQTALARRAPQYGQPAPTPAPEQASQDNGPDLVSLAISLLSTVIVCALLYKLVNDPAAPPTPVPAARAAAAAAAPLAPVKVHVNQPFKPLPPILLAVNAKDWETVRTLMAQAKPRKPALDIEMTTSAGLLEQGTKDLLDKQSYMAILSFSLAVQLNGANIEARSKLGTALIGAGDYEGAREALGDLLDAAPDHLEGWRNMAEAAALAEQPDQADASLRMLLHLSKNRKETIDELKQRAAAGEPDRFGETVARVLKPAVKKKPRKQVIRTAL
ncbi:tetratricopeptide repeat protein [Massilia sp. CCM 8733]|uniref:Tetratricopeptide repeat protein n=1 Tax=Massilia mucilaginosa TaxID=2609282 RepID=A0ABX0NU28_9BURK|nr:tetratricopeptide repeat protein [Massilia mucilaginosa]NHZ90266.1 tetratricopeptide repeat protein [Massilia mucilaginosa]